MICWTIEGYEIGTITNYCCYYFLIMINTGLPKKCNFKLSCEANVKLKKCQKVVNFSI